MSEVSRKKTKNLIFVEGILVVCVLFFFVYLAARWRSGGENREQVVIAVPYSEWVQDYENNYYTRWLEERAGIDISFVYLDEGYERESLHAMLMSENGNVDGVFLPTDQRILSFEEYQSYIGQGRLCAPQGYLPLDSSLSGLREAYPEVDFSRLLGENGDFFCYPSLKMTQTGKNMQVLWINIDWLTRLNLTIPRTTEEFKTVLEAFRDGDPNGNGKRDELPLVSCEAVDFLKSYRYLLNAFAYYDGTLPPANNLSLSQYGMTKEGQALRSGISFCGELYEEGLLVGDGFSYTQKQFMELVNDPTDLVGAFASHSIADVVYTDNPGILAHFVQLAPLSSEVLEKGYAVHTDIYPDIGGLIPSNAVHKEKAAEILDLMLSKEASLIALYGEEGVDWRFSRDGELSTYGTRAKVTTIRYLKGEKQSKNYAGAGPLAAPAEYLDGVTWNGDHSMTEYIDARAVKAYEAYYVPEDFERNVSADDGTRTVNAMDYSENAVDHLDRGILEFITGKRDVGSDLDWERFWIECEALGKYED